MQIFWPRRPTFNSFYFLISSKLTKQNEVYQKHIPNNFLFFYVDHFIHLIKITDIKLLFQDKWVIAIMDLFQVDSRCDQKKNYQCVLQLVMKNKMEPWKNNRTFGIKIQQFVLNLENSIVLRKSLNIGGGEIQ